MDGTGRSGTLTFLFTDIESSTALWDRYPTAMAAALVRHDAIVRRAVAASSGAVFSAGGDGFGVVFERADDGLAAACRIRELVASEPWPAQTPVRVRMGLHTGVAEARDGNYFGSAVNRAARVSARAVGGQILLSEATAALVADGPWLLVDAGLHDLKGLERAERLFHVHDGAAGVEAVVPAPMLIGTVPRRRPGLVGREGDIDRIVPLLGPGAVVTLRGPGGVGKTRLATTVADVARAGFADGAWFVDLSGTSDRAGVLAATVTGLGLFMPVVAPEPLDLAVALGRQRRLVLFDNCEHVLDAVAELVDGLVGACHELAVLATSRERLGCAGERVVAVEPLATAGTGGLSSAGELLLERVVGRVPEFVASADDRAGIEAIAALVDGMPLALELAAAQVGVLGVDQVRRRLERALTLGDDRRRTAARHRTLTDSIAWSYGLLSDDERTVFDRLAVFPHTFDLPAAEAVAALEADHVDVATVVTALVEKSLLTVVRADGLVRYRMLAMSREFGRARLVERGELDECADRLAAHVVEWSRQAHHAIRTSDEGLWHRRFVYEWDNVRTAYRRAHERGDGDTMAELLWRIGWWAQTRLRMEVGDWLEEARRLPHVQASRRYPLVLATTAAFARLRQQYEAVPALLDEAELVEERLGPSAEPLVAWERLRQLGLAGDPEAERALSSLAERVAGDPLWDVQLDWYRYLFRVLVRIWSGADDDEGQALRRELELMRDRAERLGCPAFIARAYNLVSGLDRLSNPSAALEGLEHAAALAAVTGNEAMERENLIDIIQLQGVSGDARNALARAIAHVDEFLGANAISPAMDLLLATFPALVELGEHRAAAIIAQAMRSDPSNHAVWIEYLTPQHLVDRIEREAGPIAELWTPVTGVPEFMRMVRQAVGEALARADAAAHDA